MKILSLFDGISCARVALEKAGIGVDKYYASEVDKYAIQVSSRNWPDIIRLGDVRTVTKESVGEIDLLIGGSPCQDLSIAKKGRRGLDGERSGLFWEYVRIMKEVKPRWFILENVNSMSKESKDKITAVMGVEPVMINASLVSAQSRKRLFWTNIPNVGQPEDRGIFLKDILLEGYAGTEKAYALTASDAKGISERHYHQKHKRNLIYKNAELFEERRSFFKELQYVGRIKGKDWAKDGKNLSRNAPQGDRIYSVEGKSATLSAQGGGRGAKTGLYLVGKVVRKLHPIECERLQCLPDGYTEGVSDTQRYKSIGNAFNVDVIAHILKRICPKT